MGFASMFEKIMENLPDETPRLLVQQRSKKATEARIGVSQPNTGRSYRPTSEFAEKVSSILSANGIPSYLITLYIKWIYWLATGQGAMDQIWHEFQWEALPQITEHLVRGDPVTRAYTHQLLRPKFENQRLGEEIKLADQCTNSARTKRWNELKGKIQHLVEDRGFGFIQTVENGVYFFHRSELLGVAYDSLRKGSQVEFEVGGRKNGGIQAIKVRLVDSYPPTPTSSSHSRGPTPGMGGMMARNKDTPAGNPADLSGRIISLVRSPAKPGRPVSDKRTKQSNIKPIATNQVGHPKYCCPKCGRALTLSKNGLHRVRRYGKKANCPTCGPVSPVDRPPLNEGGFSAMKVLQTPQQLITIHSNGTGFVFNDLRRIRSYSVWGTLHKAGCTSLLKMASGSDWTDKYWFSTGQKVLDWLTHQNDPGGRAWRPCGICRPSPKRP